MIKNINVLKKSVSRLMISIIMLALVFYFVSTKFYPGPMGFNEKLFFMPHLLVSLIFTYFLTRISQVRLYLGYFSTYCIILLVLVIFEISGNGFFINYAKSGSANNNLAEPIEQMASDIKNGENLSEEIINNYSGDYRKFLTLMQESRENYVHVFDKYVSIKATNEAAGLISFLNISEAKETPEVINELLISLSELRYAAANLLIKFPAEIDSLNIDLPTKRALVQAFSNIPKDSSELIFDYIINQELIFINVSKMYELSINNEFIYDYDKDEINFISENKQKEMFDIQDKLNLELIKEEKILERFESRRKRLLAE